MYTSTIFMAGNVSGPILGGWLIQHLDWRFIFWINVPVGLVGLYTAFHTLKLLPRHEKPHRLDWLGAGFLAGASLCLLLSISWASVRYGWASTVTCGLAFTSLIFWLAFGRRLHTAHEPFIDAALFRNRIVFPAIVTTGSGVAAFAAIMVFVPLYFAICGLSPYETGLALIPLAVGGCIGTIISARVAGWMENYSWLPMLALAAWLGISILLAFFALRIPLSVVIVALGIISFCNGASMIICTIAIQNALRPHQFGTATATMNFTRSLMSAVVIGVISVCLPVVAGQVSVFDQPANLAPEQAAILFQRLFAITSALNLLAIMGFILMEKKPFKTEVYDSAAPGSGQ